MISKIFFAFLLSLKIDFILAKSVDPDEISHNAAFPLGLHSLSKWQLGRGGEGGGGGLKRVISDSRGAKGFINSSFTCLCYLAPI